MKTKWPGLLLLLLLLLLLCAVNQHATSGSILSTPS
jgi:hypothetical protein